MAGPAHISTVARHKCLVIACGALAKEIVFLRNHLGVSDEALALKCLPAEFHNTPDKIAPGVEALLKKHRQHYDRVLVAYGECGTGGALDAVLRQYDAERLPGAHCYEFFAGTTQFERITDAEIGSFFLTDYLVKNFDRLVIKGLGLDRYPELTSVYFCHYKQVVYLAQTDDTSLQKKAAEAAGMLGLHFVYKKVGYGDLATELETLVREKNLRMPASKQKQSQPENVPMALADEDHVSR